MHPRLLATLATIALGAAVVRLYWLPPAPGPSALPMPHAPVPAVFQVVNTPGAGILADAEGFPLPNPLQTRERPDGLSETYFGYNLPPTNQSAFTLQSAASPSIRLSAEGSAFATERDGVRAFDYFVEDRLHDQSTGFIVQPHDADAYVSLFRYRAEGKWVGQRLQKRNVYLTSPKLVNFGAEYLSEDGKVRSTVEVFEPAQMDAMRSYMKLVVEAMDTVSFDDPSSQPFRLYEAVCRAGQRGWTTVSYLAGDESEHRVNLEEESNQVVGAALAEKTPYVAAFGSACANMGWLISRVDGSVKGQPIHQLALGYDSHDGAPHVFLTVPGVEGFDKGDHIEAHIFVMPYDGADAGPSPVAAQRALYGAGLAHVEMQHGFTAPGYPRRIKLANNGVGEFDVVGGAPQTPVIIEGLPPNKTPLLWEKRADAWTLVNRTPDVHQLFRTPDGTISAVFLLDLAPDGSRHFGASTATGLSGMHSAGDSVVLSGGAIDLLSPLQGIGQDSQPIDGTPFFRSRVTNETQVN